MLVHAGLLATCDSANPAAVRPDFAVQVEGVGFAVAFRTGSTCALAVRVDREVTVAGAIGACTGAAALAGR